MDEPSRETEEEQIRDGITLAKNMRNNGKSLAAIETRLVGRGFDATMLKAVMQYVPLEEPKNIIVSHQAQTRSNIALVIVGLMISGLGAFVVIGNTTGLAATVPYFGFMIMVFGGVLMAAGRS